MALFLCSEVTIFGTLIGSYFYLDFRTHTWPPPGIAPPSVALPLIATAGLVATSVPVGLSARASLRGERGRVLVLIALAMLVQLGYLAGQILLFRHDLRQFTPHGSAYGSIYFTLLAAHHAHVLLGILLDATLLLFIAVRGLDNHWLIGVRGLALYWHVVNAVAVFVLLTQLSPSL
jgi:heme/copper-type cytochrome/quinol oxidase subunit 3